MFTPLKASLLCCLPAMALSPLLAQEPLEFGAIDISISDSWVQIDLENNYTSPIVSMGSITRNDEGSLVAQVRNVTATSFEIRVVDWGQAGTHTGTETVSFIAMEEGRHEIGGVTFEAGKKDDFGALPFVGNLQTGYLSINFNPIVKQEGADGDWNYSAFTQIVGDADPSAIHCRHNITASWTDQLRFRFEQARDDTSEMAISELHYIVVQAGEGVTSNGIPFKSFSTDRLYEEIPKDLEFGVSYPDPLIYGRLPFVFGGDSTALRITDVSDTKLTAYADEGNGWNKLHTTESVALLVVGDIPEPEPVDPNVTDDLTINTLTANTISAGDITSGSIDTGSLNVTDLGVQNINVTGSLVLNGGSGSPFTVDVSDLRSLAARKLDLLAIGENAVASGSTKLAVDGDVNVSGSLVVDGNTVLTGDVVLDEVQGDLSMGEFGE